MSADNAIVVNQNFTVSPTDLWSVITTTSHMKNWFFSEIKSFNPVRGFKTEFAVRVEGDTFIHQWNIIEVQPHRKIVFDWRYKHYEGSSIVSFEIVPTASGCRLKLIHIGWDSFKGHVAFSQENCRKGWEYFIGTALPAHINKIGKIT